MLAVSVSEMEWIAEAMVPSVKALLARRKKFDREDHAERVRLAILEVDVDGLKDAVQSSLPNLTANERDKLVIEYARAIRADAIGVAKASCSRRDGGAGYPPREIAQMSARERLPPTTGCLRISS